MGNLTGKEVAQMHKDYVMQSWSKSGVDALPVEKAKGIYFWDYDGKKYADMASLLVCSNLGHELPEIVEAIKEQVPVHATVNTLSFQIRCALWHRRMLQSQRASLQRC